MDPELETLHLDQQGPLQHTGQPGQQCDSPMGTASQAGPPGQQQHAGQPGQHGPDPNALTDPDPVTSRLGQQCQLGQHAPEPNALTAQSVMEKWRQHPTWANGATCNNWAI